MKIPDAEAQLKQTLNDDGWIVYRKGWPDFLCIRQSSKSPDSKDVMFVEVKNYRGEMLKQQQHLVLTTLAGLGMNCFKWSPDAGFERINANTPLPVIEKSKRTGRKRLTLEEKIARMTPEEQARLKELEAQGKTVYI